MVCCRAIVSTCCRKLRMPVTTRRACIASSENVFEGFAQGGVSRGSELRSTNLSKHAFATAVDPVKPSTNKRPRPSTGLSGNMNLLKTQSEVTPTKGSPATDREQDQPSMTKKPKKSLPKARPPSALTQDPGVCCKALRIGQQLDELYPEPPIPLTHGTPFQLLVSVMLSAQTTDKKVNEVTPALFSLAPTAVALSQQQPSTVEAVIKEIGLAPTKSKNLCAMAKVLVEEFGGEVPDSIDALEQLPGVGHKTASVIVAQAFGKPAFPIDTHIHRLAQRWGLTPVGGTVEQTEADLKELWPADTWIRRHLQVIYFGREHCAAQRHDPSSCPICSYAAVPLFNKVGVSPPRPGQKGTRR